MLALLGAKLIDGTGRESLEKTAILVEEGFIRSVGKAEDITIPESCESIDITGKTIMPGMIDTHVHLVGGPRENQVWKWGVLPPLLEHPLPLIGLKAYARARRTLEMGFTTLRDVGDIGFAAIALRDAIEEGIVEGPRIKASGPYLNTSAGHGYAMPPWLVRNDLFYPAADGVDGVLKAVRQIIKMNADWIKFTATGGATTNTWDKQQFNDEEISTLVKEAHDKGRLVACHAVWGKGALVSANYGVDSIEHGCELTDEIVDIMLDKGIYLVPTLYAPQLISKKGADFGFTQEALRNLQEAASKHGNSFRRALSAGVKIAMGTDSGYGPVLHGTNAYELELMVENGMTQMQAIQAATQTAAECLRIDDRTGTIEPGKWADIIVVDGDPVMDITVLQKKDTIRMVMKEGEIYVNKDGGTQKVSG